MAKKRQDDAFFNYFQEVLREQTQRDERRYAEFRAGMEAAVTAAIREINEKIGMVRDHARFTERMAAEERLRGLEEEMRQREFQFREEQLRSRLQGELEESRAVKSGQTRIRNLEKKLYEKDFDNQLANAYRAAQDALRAQYGFDPADIQNPQEPIVIEDIHVIKDKDGESDEERAQRLKDERKEIYERAYARGVQEHDRKYNRPGLFAGFRAPIVVDIKEKREKKGSDPSQYEKFVENLKEQIPQFAGSSQLEPKYRVRNIRTKIKGGPFKGDQKLEATLVVVEAFYDSDRTWKGLNIGMPVRRYAAGLFTTDKKGNIEEITSCQKSGNLQMGIGSNGRKTLEGRYDRGDLEMYLDGRRIA